MEPQLFGVAAERPLGATAAQLHKRVPEYVRFDLRAKVFGLLFAHLAALLAITRLTVLFLPLPEWPADPAKAGTTTTAPAPDAAETESPDDPNKWHVWSSIGWGLFWTIMVVILVGAVVILVAEIFNILGIGRKTQYGMCNVVLVAALLQWQQDYQLRTLLPELLFVLSATLLITTGINLALSARFRALSGDLVGDSAVQGRWTGRGIVLAGVKVAGPAPSTLPSLPLLLAWLAAAWLGRACVGAHSDVVMTSFAVVWLFLIDADAPLQHGDPDDHLRIVVLLHSKVALLLLAAALDQLSVIVVGPGLAYVFFHSIFFQLVMNQVNPALRKAVLHSWPGPPPAERLEAERLRLEAERRAAAAREAHQLMLEMEGLTWENDRERKQEVLQRLQQILQILQILPAGHRAAAAAGGEELPV